ncbi:glutamine amidotransferase [Terriglobus roseus]|uniref:Uncharacterized membrane protein n=1 Tax=Terriglobus roseus TaxID=392734 RepID=A0A1H4LMB4_9BACT|nr:glutamine amidotransferase [Terriglobus roseus]SEB71415.1 Uncharacterized membrane protein [Terriglobus roseus]
MFPLLFKYPSPVFTKGHLVFLSSAPVWLLPVLIVLASAGLAVLIQYRLRQIQPGLRGEPAALSPRRAWAIWAAQSLLVALILVLLWQPAMNVAELSSQQNIIAVVVDDSKSMATTDVDDKPREQAALTALQSGVLDGLNKRFRTRLYKLDRSLTQVNSLDSIVPTAPATHLGDGLQQLANETSDLPVGAVVLLTDGGENAAGMGGSGIGLEAMQALRNRRLPVHTVAFGSPELKHDVEVEDVSVSPTVVANARIAATITFTQHGYVNGHATVTVRDGDKTLAAHDVMLGQSGVLQSEPLYFYAGAAGARTLRFSVEPIAGEENTHNNTLTRPVLVSASKRRILYIEGEPRWQFRFLRRAEEDDPTVQVVSMLRTSENKIYRQGISGPDELADGFPSKAEDLFQYSGIIIGSVDADYFTPTQQELIREYVDRRGGGVLFLGGRSSLSDGGWTASSLNDLLPTFLPGGRNNFHRNAALVNLTDAGVQSPITRLLEDPQRNAERWRKLTYLADYEDPGSPKPGATVLAEMSSGGRRKMPMLITQSYGNGRTAILATGGTWRWQMSEALGDPSHNLFWQQLLRWLVADTPGGVSASVSARTLSDQGHLQITAQVRSKDFQPARNARVSAHVSGPEGANAVLDMTPSQETPGLYIADYTAEKAGPYLTEVTADANDTKTGELGRDVVTFQRENGVAENFHTEANPRLLEQLAKETGGRAWSLNDLKDLPRDISYSEAGISVRSTKELWNMPIVFLLLLGLPVAEWLLRRKWGVV